MMKENSQYRKTLNKYEREMIKGVVEGKRNPNSYEVQKVLSRPHVAIAIESILDSAGLSDDKLCGRLRQVVNRKPVKSKNRSTGSISTNQTAIDANAIQAIRTIWQVKQYFKDNPEVGKSGLSQLSEEQLDSIIASGADVIQMTQIKQKDKKEDATSR